MNIRVVVTAEKRIGELEQEVADLRKALKPLAEAWKEFEEVGSKKRSWVLLGIQAKDCRAAAKAFYREG